MAKISSKKSALFIYWHELCALMLVGASLYLVLSVVTFSRLDNSFFYISSKSVPVHNAGGVFGAYLAWTLLYLFGASCIYLVGLSMMSAYFLFKRINFSAETERVIALLVILFVSAALCNIYMVDFLGAPYPGGYFGSMITQRTTVFFGNMGALIFLHMLFLIAWILLLRFSFISVCRYIVQALAKICNKKTCKLLYNAARAIGQAVIASIYKMYKWAGRVYSGAFMSDAYTVQDFEKLLLDVTLYEHDVANNAQEKIAQFVSAPAAELKMSTAVSVPENFTPLSKQTPPPPAQVKINQPIFTRNQSFTLPNLNLFTIGAEQYENKVTKEHEQSAQLLEEKLKRFDINGTITAIKPGPVVTLYEYQPDIDTKLSKICALEDDLALALQAVSIRIIAPIPGRSVVGFEVANKQRKDVSFARVIKSTEFAQYKNQLPLILGQDTVGKNVIVDLASMPHLLVAGSTGSGKSVALNAMLISLLAKCTPAQLRLVLIDPKRLEFSAYADIAHLLFPIITDPKRATLALRWVVKQMEERYAVMAQHGARNIFDFNAKVQSGHIQLEAMPAIVVIIDELADLMMTASKDTEDLIARITQMARAAGIHLIVATQRPSVDVITGLIKVNFPSRISFRVTSKIDSRTILDCAGADKLLGRGDMLFLDAQGSTLKRVHGAYVSDAEIGQVVAHVRNQQKVEYLELNPEVVQSLLDDQDDDDQIYQEVLHFLQGIDEVSISLLQRKFRIGFNRSARIIEKLEMQGRIMSADGGKTRKVLR